MSRTLRRKRKTSDHIRDGRGQYQSYGCRHHGDCEHCKRNRLYASQHRAPVPDGE